MVLRRCTGRPFRKISNCSESHVLLYHNLFGCDPFRSVGNLPSRRRWNKWLRQSPGYFIRNEGLTTDFVSRTYEAGNVFVHEQVRSIVLHYWPGVELLANSDLSWTPFLREADRERSDHHASTSRPQHMSIVGNSSGSELHWAGGPHRERYASRSLQLEGQGLIALTSLQLGTFWRRTQHEFLVKHRPS